MQTGLDGFSLGVEKKRSNEIVVRYFIAISLPWTNSHLLSPRKNRQAVSSWISFPKIEGAFLANNKNIYFCEALFLKIWPFKVGKARF